MDLPGMPGLRSLNPARAPAVQRPKPPRFPAPRWGWGGDHLGAQGPRLRGPGEGKACRDADRLFQARQSARQTLGSWHHAALTRWTQLGPSSTCVFWSGFPSMKTKGLSPWISRGFLVPALRCSSSMFLGYDHHLSALPVQPGLALEVARCPALGSLLCTTSRR